MHDSSSRSCSISCRVSSPTPSARQFIDNELDIVSLVDPLGRQVHDSSSITCSTSCLVDPLGRREHDGRRSRVRHLLSRQFSRTTRARQFVDTCSTSCLVDPLARRDGDRGSSASTVNGPFVPIGGDRTVSVPKLLKRQRLPGLRRTVCTDHRSCPPTRLWARSGARAAGRPAPGADPGTHRSGDGREVSATVDHSDIRGLRPHNRDSSGAASD